MHALFAAAYVWTQVLVPGKTPVSQFGINDKGEVTVNTDDGTTGIWSHGKFTPLPDPPASCNCTVFAFAVNDDGIIAGTAFANDTGLEGGFILVGSTYRFFSWGAFENTEARGIGDQGLVVGFGWQSDFSNSAGFVYDPSTDTFTNVTPGSTYPTFVQGINRFGRVAGQFVQPTPRRSFAFLAQYAPGAGTLPFSSRFQIVQGSATRARGINDYGAMVGFLFDPSDGSQKAWVGSDTTGYAIVVPPGGDAPGVFPLCSGINNHFQVACLTSDSDGNTLGLFIGTPTSPQAR